MLSNLFICTMLAMSVDAGPAPAAKRKSTAFPGSTRPFYVALSVTDVEKSAQWYETTLGLKRLDDERAPDGAWRIVNLTSDDIWVELIWDRRDQAVANARGIVKVGFAVDNVDDVVRHAEGSGSPRPRVVEAGRYGVRIVQLRDPDGNILQFSSPRPAGPRAGDRQHRRLE